MILVEMKSADKDKIKNCELLGGLKKLVSLFKVTYLRQYQAFNTTVTKPIAGHKITEQTITSFPRYN